MTDEGRRLALKATGALNTEVFGKPGLSAKQVTTLVDVLEALRRDAGDLA